MNVNFNIKDLFYLGALAALGFFVGKNTKHLKNVDDEFQYHLYPYMNDSIGSIWREMGVVRRDINGLKGVTK